MNQLGQGLDAAKHHEDALSVQEAELAMTRRLGLAEQSILVVQTNLAITYGKLGQFEQALQLKRDVYYGNVKLYGEENESALSAALNYSLAIFSLKRFEDAKALLRKLLPMARRVLGESHDLTLRMRVNYAMALYVDTSATLDDIREAVTTLEETSRTARRVLGGTHPIVAGFERTLHNAQAKLRAREVSPGTA
tara:strand:- start:16 stop:597 length:582 start_codon:yes stop_codon:yes gene_type:complete